MTYYKCEVPGPGGYEYGISDEGHRRWEVSIKRRHASGWLNGPTVDVQGSLRKAKAEAVRLTMEFMDRTAGDEWPPPPRQEWPGPGKLRWLDDEESEEPEHPVIAELRTQPGRWASFGTLDEAAMDAEQACRRHPNVQTTSWLNDEPVKARWIPDPVPALIASLKENDA